MSVTKKAIIQYNTEIVQNIMIVTFQIVCLNKTNVQKIFKISRGNQQLPTDSTGLKKQKMYPVICHFQVWMIEVLIVSNQIVRFLLSLGVNLAALFLFLFSILPPPFYYFFFTSVWTDQVATVHLSTRLTHACSLTSTSAGRGCQGSTFRISWNSSWHYSENTSNDQWNHWVWMNFLCVWKPCVWTYGAITKGNLTEWVYRWPSTEAKLGQKAHGMVDTCNYWSM